MEQWLISGISGLAAVLISIAYTWISSRRDTMARHRGIRALLSAEQMHNQAALHSFLGEMQSIVSVSNKVDAMRAFVAVEHDLLWQSLRWDTPEVGEVLSPDELLRRSEWYFDLRALELLYRRLIEQVRPIVGTSTALNPQVVQAFAGQLQGIIDYSARVLADPPAVPDPNFETDPRIKRYVEDLKRRSQMRLENAGSAND